MNHLPGPLKQPHAPQAGQTTLTNTDHQRIDRIADAFNHALEQATAPPTFYKDPTPVPAIGTTPPVTQPGRPPMSQKAVDLNTTILSSSVLAAVLGGSATAVMWASGHANPAVIAWICCGAVAVPGVLALPVLALKSLMKSAKEVVQAAPPEIHNHYSGAVQVYEDRRTVNSRTTGIVASTRNALPPTR